jgi:hypothetical protein
LILEMGCWDRFRLRNGVLWELTRHASPNGRLIGQLQETVANGLAS